MLDNRDGGNADRPRPAVAPPIEARITPLAKPVRAGQRVSFSGAGSVGRITDYRWDFGDGAIASGKRVGHAYQRPGIHKVTLTVSDGSHSDTGIALVRAHSDKTARLPQVLLDTDAKNEQDDQHYLGYALFSEVDILGINSTHHGGGQEPENFAEIQNVIGLARQSGLAESRAPLLFRGANQRLSVPESGRWFDTDPIRTEASEAILAAARGASPGHPVWIVPVGPATNPASAILQARREGLDLKGRVRFLWLGGSDNEIGNEFNANNDPWSAYVMCQSGVDTWIIPAPVGALVAVNKVTEGSLYADNPLGRYLKGIVPAGPKPLYDPSALSVIISERLGLGWVKRTEPVLVSRPRDGYRWAGTDKLATVRIIREIDHTAMQRDLFRTMRGHPTRLMDP